MLLYVWHIWNTKHDRDVFGSENSDTQNGTQSRVAPSLVSFLDLDRPLAFVGPVTFPVEFQGTNRNQEKLRARLFNHPSSHAFHQTLSPSYYFRLSTFSLAFRVSWIDFGMIVALAIPPISRRGAGKVGMPILTDDGMVYARLRCAECLRVINSSNLQCLKPHSRWCAHTPSYQSERIRPSSSSHLLSSIPHLQFPGLRMRAPSPTLSCDLQLLPHQPTEPKDENNARQRHPRQRRQSLRPLSRAPALCTTSACKL